jgi:hypothetical protein
MDMYAASSISSYYIDSFYVLQLAPDFYLPLNKIVLGSVFRNFGQTMLVSIFFHDYLVVLG